MPEPTDAEQTWSWLGSSDLKIQTEVLICAAQEQALSTNYVKPHTDPTAVSLLCKMCLEKGESVCHLVSKCKKLAHKEFKRRHNNMVRIIHWTLCESHQLERKEKW